MSAPFWIFHADSIGGLANVSIQPSKFPSLKLSLNVPAQAGRRDVNSMKNTIMPFILPSLSRPMWWRIFRLQVYIENAIISKK
jgi:hypothetical protein